MSIDRYVHCDGCGREVAHLTPISAGLLGTIMRCAYCVAKRDAR